MHQASPPRKAILRPSSAAIAFIALLIGNIALAFGPWFVRMTDVGPVAAGFWRITLAAPILLLLARASGSRPFTEARGLWWVLGASGLLFAGDLATWHIGIHHTKLANATLFGNCASLIYPIYGFFIARAWPSRTQGAALLLALIGAAVLMGRSAEMSAENLVGDLFCMVAGILYAAYFIFMARARATMKPLPALALSSVAASLPLLIVAIAMGEQVMPANWTPLITLALVSQVFGQGLMIYALGALSPLVIGLALLTQPIVAAAIGWSVYGERLGLLDLFGAVMIAIALVLVRRASGGDKAAS
ncbi:MAG: DMT family transporter [Candidatus Sphingomonas colombiensis]|nr:DMT family transporter [Sphingomonas sp.]WEK44476.1 MAG: DMT family transporter [Sphingomonas sp.]